MVAIEAVLHPEEAALVWAALERIAKERCRAKNVPAGTSARSRRNDADAPENRPAGHTGPSVGARPTAFSRADALIEMVQAVMRGDRPDRSSAELVVSIPVETLHARAAHDPSNIACCADGTAISSAAARRLACDAGLVAMIEDQRGNILAVGRKQRTISGSMKRALLKRDQTCRFPGCQSRIFLEGHHIKHWADGGQTELSNLVSTCSFHHRFLHEYGFTIELRDDGTVVAFDDRGRAIHEVPAVPRTSDLGWPNLLQRNDGLDIDSETIECWDGTPVDYGALVDCLVRADYADETN
jgi:hypothetical protein